MPAARTVRPTLQKAKTALLTAIVDLEEPESLGRRVETWSAAKLAKPQKAVGQGGNADALQDTHVVSLVKGAYRLTISLQRSGDVAMQKMYRSQTNSWADIVEARDRSMLVAVLRLREEHGEEAEQLLALLCRLGYHTGTRALSTPSPRGLRVTRRMHRSV